MPKQNAAILLNRYIWLVDTIYSAGSISREEIDRRWCRSLLSEGAMYTLDGRLVNKQRQELL